MNKTISTVNKEIVLQATNISKRYQTAGTEDVEVFKDISITLYQGEIVTLIGPSGSGKSTMLHILGTLDSPSTGTVVIEGKDTSTLSDDQLSDLRNKRIGFIFQFHHLLPEFTALENVLMPALIAGQNQDEIRERGEMLLKEVGLGHRMHHKPSAISGGEAQRVAVARAFLMSPATVLADEPTGNLDVKNSDMLFDIITNLCRKLNQTFLIATHNLELASRADRTLLLQNGVLADHRG